MNASPNPIGVSVNSTRNMWLTDLHWCETPSCDIQMGINDVLVDGPLEDCEDLNNKMCI